MTKDRAREAFEAMASHKMNCAQTTFCCFAEDLGLERRRALEISQGFGGGMHINSLCGAVTGAYMALGLANKIQPENPRSGMDKTNEQIKEFNRKFTALYGSLYCTKLCGFNLSIPEQSAKAREKGVFASVCPALVRDSVKIVEDLLKI
ncbi:MAG TPA: C-GCAxxG-C-C family protein [Dehalococcoidales bacterium]|nr:C-GCAxxG-C-C family protein [Dehalococcoidales bacterium]